MKEGQVKDSVYFTRSVRYADTYEIQVVDSTGRVLITLIVKHSLLPDHSFS